MCVNPHRMILAVQAAGEITIMTVVPHTRQGAILVDPLPPVRVVVSNKPQFSRLARRNLPISPILHFCFGQNRIFRTRPEKLREVTPRFHASLAIPQKVGFAWRVSDLRRVIVTHMHRMKEARRGVVEPRLIIPHARLPILVATVNVRPTDLRHNPIRT